MGPDYLAVAEAASAGFGPPEISLLVLAGIPIPKPKRSDRAIEAARDGWMGDGMTGSFDRYDADDVRDLLREYPLAWFCAADGRADHSSLLPLLGEYDEDGALTHIVGHMGRRNPLFAVLTAAPRALALICGPQAYVSPDHAEMRNWAPTWNYAQLRIEADVIFDTHMTEPALEMLLDAMGTGRTWQTEELGDRYPAMLGAIVGFRAVVTKVVGRFKLGQDESAAALRAILTNHTDLGLVRWMRRFNEERL